MRYTVVLLKKHHKEIAKLSPSEQGRVYTSLKALEDNPRPPGKKIAAFRGLPKGLRLRIGDIRVIFTVNDITKQVFVVEIGRRGDIY
ncbi:type II toxin-antitoxin system RelE/ParE family toxin [Candidatus Gottesmanbacteria bacterium]|nr:type II toxin-antitoxin system RelE/ParE family toxin [Candidatus Gottesmanbacteria bacterium]